MHCWLLRVLRALVAVEMPRLVLYRALLMARLRLPVLVWQLDSVSSISLQQQCAMLLWAQVSLRPHLPGVAVANMVDFPGSAVSVSAWIRLDAATSNDKYFLSFGIPGNADELCIGVEGTSRRLTYVLRNVDLYSSPNTAAVSVGVWAWVCVSYSPGVATLYIDGTQWSLVGAVPSSALGSSGTLVIGQESDGSVSSSGFSSFYNTAFWVGLIGQVSLLYSLPLP
jgi:hypothetical protein